MRSLAFEVGDSARKYSSVVPMALAGTVTSAYTVLLALPLMMPVLLITALFVSLNTTVHSAGKFSVAKPASVLACKLKLSATVLPLATTKLKRVVLPGLTVLVITALVSGPAPEPGAPLPVVLLVRSIEFAVMLFNVSVVVDNLLESICEVAVGCTVYGPPFAELGRMALT